MSDFIHVNIDGVLNSISNFNAIYDNLDKIYSEFNKSMERILEAKMQGKYMEELEIIFDDWKAINKNSLNEIKKLKNILELVGNSYIGLVEESRDKL